ncbi:MAG: hypothetical protein ACJAYS_000454 [Lentimonas sp.]|jgi:hypothetical protein
MFIIYDSWLLFAQRTRSQQVLHKQCFQLTIPPPGAPPGWPRQMYWSRFFSKGILFNVPTLCIVCNLKIPQKWLKLKNLH